MAASLGAAGKKGGENFLRELRAAFDKRMADLKVQLAKGLIDPAQFKVQANLAAKEFNAGVIKGMESARKAGTLTDSVYLKLSRTLKKTGDDGAMAGGRVGSAFLKAGAAISGFLAARFGIQQFAKFLADSVHQAIEAEDSTSRLDSVLQPLGISYRAVSRDVESYFSRLQKTTRFSDTDAREALVNLITVTGDYKLSLRLLDVTAKIAEKRHTTMADAAQTAADASRGLTKGMKDLGVSAKDTGDIVAKIDRNLGNLAEEGAKKGSGAIAQMNNLWKSFQEKIGAAIIGSDRLKDSIGPNGLLGALISLNDWAEKSSKAISGFVDKLVWVGKGVARVSQEILKVIPNPLMIAKGLDLIRGKQKGLFDDVVSGESTTAAAVQKGGRRRRELTADELAEIERLRKESADTLADLGRKVQETELAMVGDHQRAYEELTRGFWDRIKKLQGSALADGIDLLAKAQQNLLLKHSGILDDVLPDRLPQKTDDVGVKAGSAIPAVQELNRELFIQKELLAAGAPLGTEFADSIADMAGRQWDAANNFSTPWIDALGIIRNEVEGQGSLFAELGQAWAEGGLKGLASLAARKVKENLAQALEMGAKAIGYAFFNPPAAAGAAASAAGHVLAAGAWRAIAGGVGGGGGGAGASSTAGIGSGAPNLSRGASMEKPGPDVSIYLTGPGFNALNPEVQRIVYGAQQNARERFGANAKIRIVRTP